METEEKPQKIPDKRKSLRYPILILKVTEEGKKEHLFGYAKNISRSGFFIQSVNPREPGERFTISFHIPKTEIRVRCRCEVVWMRKYHPKEKLEPGYGIRFLDLSPGVADAIDAWIKQQS
ncbi:MAG: PilZ domain-containing protein [Nitrospirae bacterium]|nr:PilZ domain-containing protein [Nitrospirota bacterium]